VAQDQTAVAEDLLSARRFFVLKSRAPEKDAKSPPRL
jgi:hypothetical protein